MNEQKFKENMLAFCENYNFEISNPYIKLVYRHLETNNVTDEQFSNGVNTLITTKKKSDFYGRPAVADWLDVLGLLKKPLDNETIAHDKASQVFSWLVANVGFRVNDWGDGKEHLSEKQNYSYEFEPEIQYVVNREFSGTHGLIQAYGEQKLAGGSSWFRKELDEAFKVNLLIGNNSLAIEGEKQKMIGNDKIKKVINNLPNFKSNRS